MPGTGSAWPSGYSPNTLVADPTAAIISALQIYSSFLADAIYSYLNNTNESNARNALDVARSDRDTKQKAYDATVEAWKAAGSPKQNRRPYWPAGTEARRALRDANNRLDSAQSIVDNLPKLRDGVLVIENAFQNISTNSTKSDLQTAYNNTFNTLSTILDTPDPGITNASTNLNTLSMIAAEAFGIDKIRMAAKAKKSSVMFGGNRRSKKGTRKGRKGKGRKGTRRR
jgi:hypothetical protein